MQVGTVHPTKNFGNVEIVEYNGWDDVVVRFLDTGYTTNCESGRVRKGKIKDALKKTVFGVGFLGGKVDNKNPLFRKCYNTWQSMLERCYDEKCLSNHPSYKGCSVTANWHNFQIFSKWFYNTYPNDGISYHLDKDIKIDGNRVYGPDACLFVTQRENNVKAKAKKYKAKNPKGEIVDIYNLTEFCRLNGLTRECLRDTLSGKQNSHKGWTIA